MTIDFLAPAPPHVAELHVASTSPDEPGPLAKAIAQSKGKAYDAELRERFIAAKEAQQWSLKDLKRMLGNSEAAFSKYLTGKPEGDVKALEAKIADLVLNAELRAQMPAEDVALFQTLVVRQIGNACDTCKKLGFMGMVIGDPGLGKTSAIKIYVGQDPMAISLTLNTVTGGGTPSALVRAFWRRINVGNYSPKDQTKGEFLLERFTGTRRLLIIDNAHLLSEKGLEWVLGFNDETGCPVVLVGNDELKRTMQKVQRGPSRIGVNTTCDLKKTKAEVVKNYLSLHWPEAVGDVAGLANEVMDRPGKLRALRQVVALAKSWWLDRAQGVGSMEEAFRMAMAKQVVNYKLAA